jgi:hypothetical protein
LPVEPASLLIVSTFLKASLLASSLLVSVAPGLAQVAASAGPPPSSVGVFPLSDIKAGQHGTAWTVFEGNVPEPFGVDILGVLRNATGPGEDMILARLTGAKAEFTGVVAGMSGSPVYIDGRLVGALAFRIGQFSKEPIAGITPIDEMLTVRDFGSSNALLGKAAASGSVEPIETPLVFTGFSPDALSLWKEHAPASLAMEPQAGLGGTSTTGSAQTPARPAKQADTLPALEPGSAVSALLVEGDMEIAATCTVTYLEKGHLLACGHPLTQFGAVSLPMTKAEIVATLASPAGSFKIVNTGAVVGAFYQDRQTAIGGMLGETARMIPVEIAIHGAAGDTQTERTLRLKVLDQAQLTPTALLVSLFQGLQETPGYAEEDSYRVKATVKLQGYPDVMITTLAAPGGSGGAPLSAALTVGLRFNELYSSSARRVPIESVKVEVEAMPGRQSIALDRATLEETSAHAGDRVTVDASMDPYRGDARTVRIPVTLPASLPSGDVRLLVSDGATLDRLAGAGRSAENTPLAGTIAQLNAMHANDRLYVTLLAPDAELSVDGQVLGSVPLSVANLLAPAHERDRGSLHGESIQALGSIPLDGSVSGQQVLTVRVE